MDISVIVCCYNSATRLPKTLEYLAKQQVEELKLEIVLVDNNSTDETSKIAEELWSSFNNPFPFKIINEPNPGLSNARKAGVYAANGEIIIFCDDDNWLKEDYVKIAHRTMVENEEIGVLGCQSIATADIEIPNWFYTHYGAYACGVLALDSGDVTHRLWVWGAGMVMRRNLLILLYNKYKHRTLGRTKENYSSGEDVEICYWHIIEGYRLWYEEKLILWHFMPKERLNKVEAKKQFDGQVNSAQLIGENREIVKNILKFADGKLNMVNIITAILKLRLKTANLLIRSYLKFKG